MTARPIVLHPDPRLRQPCAPVTAFDPELQALSDDLLESMRAAEGVGITGPHVGVLQRITVIDLGQGPVTYVNPAILEASADSARFEEGSISMPGVRETILRPARVLIAYQDLSGATHRLEAEGFLACCLQHEIDQLDGVFWLERLSKLRRDRLIKRYEKIARRGPP
ncbi:peptide deformylase [Arboricoccus pini]|uniref:Peptide deformylase-like n=1 Tax=Arboricoccus pini TaxID=1963835 RepID=A0A212PY81_9PROT|nr:peptide deformylase [Arboricoccus pini]SNB51924.1 peptide deformylase [Arboricoccus pini]